MKVFSRDRRNAVSPVEELREELGSLTEAARSGDSEAARRALHLRHRIGLAELDHPAEDIGYVEPAPVPIGADGLPEVGAEDLTAAAVRGAVLDRGCLLVRGLVQEDVTKEIVSGIDRAFESLRAVETGAAAEHGYFEPFAPDPRFPLYERSWISSAGGLWTADSPFLAAEVYALFEELGIAPLVREYLEEQPLLSVQKGTFRKVSPGRGGAWHQDGYFLGSAKALNVWISLSRCGDVAPGMDLVPRRLDEIAATGTEGSPLDWTVADDVARDLAGDRGVVRPIFNAGDALLFDEMFLHTTAKEEAMPLPRYALETWFFGSSGYPPEYAPLAL